MAENNHHQAGEKAYVSPQVNPYGRMDEDVASVAQRDERRKKRVKCFAYVAVFVVVQSIIFMIFGLTIMKVRTPKFHVSSATFGTFEVSTSEANPSFNINMIAGLSVRNRNFGQYKYQNTTVEFFFGGTTAKVGEALVVRARAKARSTRRFLVTVDLSSAGVPAEVLANEFRTNASIPLTSRSTLRGKVEIMKLMKKNKSTTMNCSMQILISSRQLGNISCR